ncbi:MAG: hypothetical protein Q8M64_04570, partial [Methyloversatilis sp.]|nr:hypothetical protein [Methyloversatilis sp.]
RFTVAVRKAKSAPAKGIHDGGIAPFVCGNAVSSRARHHMHCCSAGEFPVLGCLSLPTSRGIAPEKCEST